ncbi:MAG TPA: hypothetical protein VNN06_10685 [Ramlibacter sp.]|nr:hypothetical protein [Ramlibacter sp.]
MTIRQSLLSLVLGLAAGHALACYTVFDRSGRVIYNDPEPPVDMSRPLHETLPARFPGGHMVFDAQADCAAVSPPLPAVVARDGAPLLTDRRTAQAMNVPYTVLQGSIVIVQPRHARVGAGVTVVPAETLAARPAQGTVITELRDPPMTIVESADGTMVGELARR